MHSLLIHQDHAAYFFAYFLFVVICGLMSTFLRLALPKVPYSLLILSIISFLFALTFNADYYGLAPARFGPLCVLGALATAAFILYSSKSTERSYFETWSSGNRFGELASSILLWVFGLGIILIPLAFAYAPTALITGHFICNDSAVHSIMTHGLGHMRSRGMDPFYFSAAPRGIHSFTLYFNELALKKPASRIILPVSLVCLSLLVFWADGLVRLLGIKSRARALIALLPTAPFLLSTSAYTIFLGQVSAMAMTLAAATAACFFRSLGSPGQALASFSLLSLGGISAYGLFSGSLVGFAAGLSAAYAFLSNPSPNYWRGRCRELFKEMRSLQGVLLTVALLILFWPCIQFATYVWKVQGSGTLASDLFSAVGNLPDGYLSPLHLSGIWPPKIGYREVVARPWSAFADILMFVVVVQTAFIVTARMNHNLILLLTTFVVPWLASAVMIDSPYVNFKYLTYLIPAFVFAAGYGVWRAGERWSQSSNRLVNRISVPLASLVLLLYMAAAIGIPLPTATIVPTVREGDLNNFEKLAAEIDHKRAVVLSREDWLQYYIQLDDILPLTLYISKAYNGEPMDRLVIDRAYPTDSMDYLKRFPDLLKIVQQGKCHKLVGDRFDSYSLPCEE